MERKRDTVEAYFLTDSRTANNHSICISHVRTRSRWGVRFSILFPSWIPRSLTLGPKGCPETSVRNYIYTLCFNPEERRSQWRYVFFTYQIPPHPLKLEANFIFEARCMKTKSSALSVLSENKETGPYINL